jgi:hypothetical protein
MSSIEVLPSNTAGSKLIMLRRGFFGSDSGRVMKKRFGQSVPTSSPQKGQLPYPRVFHIRSKVDVQQVAVQETTGVS